MGAASSCPPKPAPAATRTSLPGAASWGKRGFPKRQEHTGRIWVWKCVQSVFLQQPPEPHPHHCDPPIPPGTILGKKQQGQEFSLDMLEAPPAFPTPPTPIPARLTAPGHICWCFKGNLSQMLPRTRLDGLVSTLEAPFLHGRGRSPLCSTAHLDGPRGLGHVPELTGTCPRADGDMSRAGQGHSSKLDRDMSPCRPGGWKLQLHLTTLGLFQQLRGEPLQHQTSSGSS